MSKSRGNILYPGDVMDGSCKPRHLRFFLLYRHYRKKLNYTQAAFTESAEYLDGFRAQVKKLLAPVKANRTAPGGRTDRGEELIRRFRKPMDDDLSFGKAFDAMQGYVKELSAERAAGRLTRSDITASRKVPEEDR